MAPTDTQTGLTQERLKSLLNYEPDTGVFTWLVSRPNRVEVGSEAGSIRRATGYRVIKVGDRTYQASRLAWLYMTGEWPECIVDHRDLNKANNAWGNLRAATYSQNQQNIGVSKHKAIGLKGVHYKSDAWRLKKWTASIRVGGSRKHLGYFEHPEEAHAAYVRAAEAHFGQFARS